MATLGPYRRVELEEIASESSEAERRADAAERELMDWKTAQFMESHLGEEYDALIISVQKFGFFVELIEIFVEGLVSIDRLEEITGQRCVYRERDHAIVTEPIAARAAAARSSGFSGLAIACGCAPNASIPCAIASNFRLSSCGAPGILHFHSEARWPANVQTASPPFLQRRSSQTRNDLVCPTCKSPLQVSALSRNISAFAALIVAAIV